jgi:molybdenum cofactor cytidylyltransferase
MNKNLCAIVLAAGLSQRMGKPKMGLPWRGSTVLGAVLKTLDETGFENILVVVGGSRELVEDIIGKSGLDVGIAFNSSYQNGEMTDSIRVGLASIGKNIEAVLIVLGDQPQMETATINLLLEEYKLTGSELIVPSYQMRRGHPWLIGRRFWPDLLNCGPEFTMRDFLKKNSSKIHYVVVDTPSIVQDLDTPEDYASGLGIS